MATLQATRMKKGMLIKMGEDLFRILELQHVTPGNLRGFVRVKMRNIRNGALADNRFRSEDTVERATLDEREMQYLYQDGDDFYFMDTTSFEQVHISSEALGDSVGYLKAEMTIQVEFYGTEPVGIELPQTVDLKIVDNSAGHQGRHRSNQIKPANLETGLVVNVRRSSIPRHDSCEHGNRDSRPGVGDCSSCFFGGQNQMDVVRQPSQGWIEVIVGSMFSGKSEELIAGCALPR
jgi:elongation factor P